MSQGLACLLTGMSIGISMAAMTNPLAEWLSEHEVSQSAFALMIGAHQTQVSRYATGARRPSRRVRKAIEETTRGGVPVKAWDSPKRKSSIAA